MPPSDEEDEDSQYLRAGFEEKNMLETKKHVGDKNLFAHARACAFVNNNRMMCAIELLKLCVRAMFECRFVRARIPHK